MVGKYNQSDTIAQDRYAAALGGLQALCDKLERRESGIENVSHLT
jgi:hypothetical protein